MHRGRSVVKSFEMHGNRDPARPWGAGRGAGSPRTTSVALRACPRMVSRHHRGRTLRTGRQPGGPGSAEEARAANAAHRPATASRCGSDLRAASEPSGCGVFQGILDERSLRAKAGAILTPKWSASAQIRSDLSGMIRRIGLLAAAALLPAAAGADPPALRIPRVSEPPVLEDFVNGTPPGALASVTDFRQREPDDGSTARPSTFTVGFQLPGSSAAGGCRPRGRRRAAPPAARTSTRASHRREGLASIDRVCGPQIDRRQEAAMQRVAPAPSGSSPA
jgi:hypothetical protein